MNHDSRHAETVTRAVPGLLICGWLNGYQAVRSGVHRIADSWGLDLKPELSAEKQTPLSALQ